MAKQISNFKFKISNATSSASLRRRLQWLGRGGLFVLGCLGFVAVSLAQQGGHATDFRTHQDFPGPNLNQRKTEFSGKDATPLAGSSKVRVKGADMKTFREDGTLVMAAKAPECVYDGGKKQANSSGPLQMQTGDGRFFIEGIGFLWNETESDLVLSNRVHSILHSETTTNGPPPSETVIFSDRFSYEMKAGLAIYRDNVKVNDPKMKLTCEVLTANLGHASAFSAGDIINLPSLRNLLVQPSDSDKVSQYLVTRISPATQKLLASYDGNTNSQLQQALAEDFNQIIQNGSIFDTARFAGVKLSPETTNLLAGTPSDADLVRLNRSLLQDAYPREISRNTVPQAGGRPDYIVAENNVIIDYNEDGEQTHATGNKAVYKHKTTGTATNEFMELTGDPKLERTNGWMTADVITMDRAKDMIRGVGNYHSVFKKPPPEAGKTNATAIADTEIFCDKFDYNTKTKVAVYQGHVRVNDPQMQLTGELLTASLPEKGRKPNHIVAETNVVIDFIEKEGRTHATGEKAVYDEKVTGAKTNAVMELSGHPKLERTDGWMSADVITMDRGEGVIRGMGHHHSTIKKQPAGQSIAGSPATADTDIFSDGFVYGTKTRVAVYTGQVRVNDPQMKLTSGIATVWLPEKGGKPDRIVAETNVVIDFFGSPLFSTGDIVNLKSLATKLKQPATNDAVSQYMSAQLSPETRKLLPFDFAGTNSPLQQALVGDFNKLIQGGPIYDAQRFAAVKLQPATTNLIGQAPRGLDLVWLNRRLLLDAYPQELSKNNPMESGEKTHATGEKAVYTYSVTGSKTNELLELTGNPMLGRPAGWTTADKIILDRNANMIRSIHNSVSKGYPGAVKKANAPTGSNQAAK